MIITKVCPKDRSGDRDLMGARLRPRDQRATLCTETEMTKMQRQNDENETMTFAQMNQPSEQLWPRVSNSVRQASE